MENKACMKAIKMTLYSNNVVLVWSPKPQMPFHKEKNQVSYVLISIDSAPNW
jgi:hypothetical protein